MLTFDASSIIHAWDNYPEKQFPPLWKWIAAKIESGEFLMSRIAFEEVEQKIPECSRFLKSAGITRLKVSNEILQEALRIKSRLGIIDENYHPDGVGENDIIIIATAKIKELELVSEESVQNKQPKENCRLKIPAVCQLPDVGVHCMSFIGMVKRSEEIFM